MTDQIETEIREGFEAAQILESPVFEKAFADYEKELLQAWQQTPVKAQGDRENLYLQIRLLQKVKTNLQTLVMSGKINREHLAKLEEKRSLLSGMANFFST
jgi:hypothetical protein